MVVQEPDVCPCPQYTQVMCSPVGPELLAINVAAVSIRRRGLLDVVGTEARSLGSTSYSMIFITLSRSHPSPVILRLMINLISGGDLLTSTDDSIPP